MNSDNDQLGVLRRLRSEGQITDGEYQDLTRGLKTEPEESQETGDETADDGPEETGSPEDGATFWPPVVKEDLSINYLGGILVVSLALIVLSALTVIPWWIAIGAGLVMLTTLFEGWGMGTLTGATALVLLAFVTFAMSLDEPSAAAVAVAATLPSQDTHPPIPGSLGIYMDQLGDKWNEVDGPPPIVKGLTRYNETGEYDTFLYRFGEWGRVAGAYDPANDAIYALLVTGWLSEPATAQLYLHLCFVVAPYSQDCIDSYFEKGLDGGALDDFFDLPHRAEWALGDQTWRLEIDQNVMTIRVFGADAA